MEREPVDPGRIRPSREKLHLFRGEPRPKEAESDERLGRNPSPARHVGCRSRELEKVDKVSAINVSVMEEINKETNKAKTAMKKNAIKHKATKAKRGKKAMNKQVATAL